MIRKANPKDASRLAEILIFAKRTAYRPIFRDDIVSFREMQVLDLALHYQFMREALKDVYVYDDGIVKGMMSLDRFGQEKGGIWQLKELYVDPFFQGQGIGRFLASGFIRSARKNSVPEVFLWVLEENAPARSFYESRGLSADGTRRTEPGTTAVLLKYSGETDKLIP